MKKLFLLFVLLLFLFVSCGNVLQKYKYRGYTIRLIQVFEVIEINNYYGDILWGDFKLYNTKRHKGLSKQNVELIKKECESYVDNILNFSNKDLTDD
jgi:hypothetical protein